MRAVLLSISETELAERRRLGLDKLDEMWDGVVHMVPPAGDPQQDVQVKLLYALFPVAERRGLVQRVETGLHRHDKDFKVPDQRSQRGAEGAELVVEIRSPDDETYDKIDWYAALGVREMLIVHPEDRRFELLRAVGGRLLPVSADPAGTTRCETLDVGLATAGDRLLITWDGGSGRV